MSLQHERTISPKKEKKKKPKERHEGIEKGLSTSGEKNLFDSREER